jgi:hypothetical protein
METVGSQSHSLRQWSPVERSPRPTRRAEKPNNGRHFCGNLGTGLGAGGSEIRSLRPSFSKSEDFAGLVDSSYAIESQRLTDRSSSVLEVSRGERQICQSPRSTSRWDILADDAAQRNTAAIAPTTCVRVGKAGPTVSGVGSIWFRAEGSSPNGRDEAKRGSVSASGVEPGRASRTPGNIERKPPL